MRNNILNLDLKNPKNWIISKIIISQYKKNPDFEIIEFIDGEKWTYKKLYNKSLEASYYINELGIKKND